MKEHTVKILDIFDLTHDVKGLRLEKPDDYTFKPGQATNVAINKEGWRDKQRPFTFTNLPGDDTLELIIKIYTSHEGVTKEIKSLGKEDELIIRKPWGSIEYRGEGLFIAGGAGITPFVSILRDLEHKGKLGNNKLLFANNTSRDIILEDEFNEMLGSEKFINILADEKTTRYHNGFITSEFLKDQFDSSDGFFYLCGPPPMMKAVSGILDELGVKADRIIKEDF